MDWNFKKLDAEFRSAPFWAWNGKLDPAQVRREVRTMHQMGMGGFFMHSRVGLETPYLGEEWFRAIDAAVDEATKLGMKPGLYDEDRWPSGAAGGLVTTELKYRMRYLEHEFIDAEHRSNGEGETLGWFAAVRGGVEVLSYRVLDTPEAPLENGETLLRIYRKIADSNPNYNGGAYLDTMNPEAVDAFLESTYECYAEHFGEKLGKVVPWIFTDEPNYLDLVDRKRRPWTDKLPELYEAQFGESLLPHLPELFYHCNVTFSSARYQYYLLVTKLFCENFGKRIGAWCEKHHIAWTGHLLREDKLSGQICAIGEAMPFYRYMQQPGMDLLTERWSVFNTAKQLSSAGHQFGKKRLLTETYGCTGWDFPLESHRVLGDWQYVLGVNFRCPHLYWYTMSGAAKRDYPASIGHQSPWYEAYPAVEDYFARLGAVLTDGEAVTPLLVVHPIESAWGRAGRYNDQLLFAPELDDAFDGLTMELLSEHLDFEFGSETVMADSARVSDGKICVGQAAYREVLIPAVDTLRASTLNLLEAFAQAGGKVHYIGAIPCYVDGKLDETGRLARAYALFTPWNLAETASGLRPVSVQDEAGECRNIIARTSCHADGAMSLFLVNLGWVPTAADVADAPWIADRTMTNQGAQIRLAGKPGLTVSELDLMTGVYTAVPSRYENGAYCFAADFPARASRLYVLSAPGTVAAIPAAPVGKTQVIAAALDKVTCSEPNVLVLDHADLSVNGQFVQSGYVLTLDDEVRKMLGGLPRGGAMLQPWKQPHTADAPALPVTLSFAFTCETVPERDVELVLEDAAMMKIACNGKEIPSRVTGYWADPALQTVVLPAKFLQAGENRLTLSCRYTLTDHGLEAIFLRGDFGVKKDATLTKVAAQLGVGSVTEQNMPYFAGNLTYEWHFEVADAARVAVRIPAWAGALLAAQFDGGAWQYKLGEPWQFVSPAALTPGKHTVKIQIYGSRRNAFGPFYCKEKFYWIGPYEFTEADPGLKKTVELGLLQAPEFLQEI